VLFTYTAILMCCAVATGGLILLFALARLLPNSASEERYSRPRLARPSEPRSQYFLGKYLVLAALFTWGISLASLLFIVSLTIRQWAELGQGWTALIQFGLLIIMPGVALGQLRSSPWFDRNFNRSSKERSHGNE
jgi:NADH:ubiquinone oxidoreductase subunit 3 (subunit A)